MLCSQVRDKLPDFSVQMLHGKEQHEVETHLAGCADCRAELHALENTMVLVEQYGFHQPPVGLFNGVRNRIESGAVVRERAPWWWVLLGSTPARAAAMGIAAAAVAVGVIWPVGPANVPVIPIHGEPGMSVSARGPLGESIRRHALSAGQGPLTDRVAWEAMAQLVTQEDAERKAPEVR
jgi:hypothetical protein